MATDMYLKLEGVEGETKRYEHEKEIEVLAWSFGGSNSSSVSSGGGSGAGKANLQDISITKWVDASSPVLFQKMCAGFHFPKGVLSIYKAGGETPLKYMELEFDGLFLTSVSTGGSGGEDRLTENVSLSFERVRMRYFIQKKDGTLEGETAGGWDLEMNQPC
jgi:type VI secretion system secreted protein Hcp